MCGWVGGWPGCVLEDSGDDAIDVKDLVGQQRRESDDDGAAYARSQGAWTFILVDGSWRQVIPFC